MYPGALPADSGLVLAPGETFPEALCGAPLAAAYGGPVLLTYKTTVLANNVKSRAAAPGAQARVLHRALHHRGERRDRGPGPAVTVTPISGAATSTP